MTIRALDLIIDTPWALRAEALEQLLAIAARANEAPEAVAARLGRPLDNARTVTLRGDTAIIPITGPIFRRANLFTEVSGATSVEILAQDLETAALDESIARIVLEIDSPGGQATGIADLAAMIRDASHIKPVVAYVDGMAASAAYWLAAAATSIVTSPTGLLGSIGVVGSYQPEKDGPIKIISSISPLKQATPDTEDGRVEAQRVVDELATIFVADVARYRGTTPDTVARDFGRGGVLVGAAAVAAGMADAVASFESLFSSSPSELSPRRVSGPSAHAPVITGENPMTDSTTAGAATDQPAITEADLQAATALGREEGMTDERTRVAAILSTLGANAGALPMALAAIATGMSADQARAMIGAAPVAALASDPAAYRAAWLADGAQSAPAADSATGAPGDEPGGDAEANNARNWANNASLRAEFGGNLDRYQAFCAATASGRVRILRDTRATHLQSATAA